MSDDPRDCPVCGHRYTKCTCAPEHRVRLTDPTADAAKLLPFSKIVERLREYSRPDRDSGIYPMMLEVEEVRALLAGIDNRPQPAPQEGEPPLITKILARPYHWVTFRDEDGSWFAEIAEFPGCFATGDTAVEAISTLRGVAESWLLAVFAQGQDVPLPSGLSTRPKVEDAQVADVLSRLRNRQVPAPPFPSGAARDKLCVEAADLLERLAGERDDKERKLSLQIHNHEIEHVQLIETKAKLAEHDAELAQMQRERDGEREARERASDALRAKDEAMGVLIEIAGPEASKRAMDTLDERHAARQQQNASAEPTEIEE